MENLSRSYGTRQVPKKQKYHLTPALRELVSTRYPKVSESRANGPEWRAHQDRESGDCLLVAIELPCLLSLRRQHVTPGLPSIGPGVIGELQTVEITPRYPNRNRFLLV